MRGATHRDPITCDRDADNQYTCTGGTDLWEPWDLMMVTSSGGTDIPAFRLMTLAPDAVALESDTGAWTSQTLDGSSSLELTWQDQFPFFRVTFLVAALAFPSPSSVGGGGTNTLRCVSMDDGQLEVPAAALAAVNEGARVKFVSIDRSYTMIKNAGGGGEITFSARSIREIELP